MRSVYRLGDGVDSALRKVMRELVAGHAPWPLFLLGPVGCGKSCAALCLCDVVEDSMYWTVERLHDAILSAKQGHLWRGGWVDEWKISTDMLWDEWRSTPLAVLDELGTRAAVSESMYETVKRAIDGREGRSGIFISNAELDALAVAYDDRIASRLAAGTTFRLAGDDRRINPQPDDRGRETGASR